MYGAYDAFLIDSRYNSSQPLSQEPEAEIPTPEAVTFRDDLPFPVINLQAETDVIPLGAVDERQPDSDYFRLWEVAGIAHNDNYQLVSGRNDIGVGPEFALVVENTSILGVFECEEPINSGAYPWVYMAAMEGLEQWVRDDVPASEAQRLDVLDDDSDYLYDDNGNVTGGLRTPYVDAPAARLSGALNEGSPGCRLSGTTSCLTLPPWPPCMSISRVTSTPWTPPRKLPWTPASCLNPTRSASEKRRPCNGMRWHPSGSSMRR